MDKPWLAQWRWKPIRLGINGRVTSGAVGPRETDYSGYNLCQSNQPAASSIQRVSGYTGLQDKILASTWKYWHWHWHSLSLGQKVIILATASSYGPQPWPRMFSLCCAHMALCKISGCRADRLNDERHLYLQAGSLSVPCCLWCSTSSCCSWCGDGGV